MIYNERIKLLANLLNTMAGSSYAIGVAAPIAATFYNAGPTGLRFQAVITGAGIWLAVGVLLHVVAQRLLGGLQP